MKPLKDCKIKTHDVYDQYLGKIVYWYQADLGGVSLISREYICRKSMIKNMNKFKQLNGIK